MADFTHHDSLWFEDGNVVLIAGTMAFCIHRGILSQKCTVFRDMMAASSPDDEETVDDHPAVRLHDDPRDLEYFVHYLYNGIRYDQYQLDFRRLG